MSYGPRNTISDAVVVRQVLLIYGASPLSPNELRSIVKTRWPHREWDYRKHGSRALSDAVWGLRRRGHVLKVESEEGSLYMLTDIGREAALCEAEDIRRIAKEMWDDEMFVALVGPNAN